MERRRRRRRWTKRQFSKSIVIFLFVNCTIIELYSMAAMLIEHDLSGLSTLIGAVVSETLAFAVYAYKAMRENTRGGITFEAAKAEDFRNNDPI